MDNRPWLTACVSVLLTKTTALEVGVEQVFTGVVSGAAKGVQVAKPNSCLKWRERYGTAVGFGRTVVLAITASPVGYAPEPRCRGGSLITPWELGSRFGAQKEQTWCQA